MKNLEYILIAILFILTVNIAVEYNTYQCLKYFDSKIELMQQSQYQKNPYLDSLTKELNKVHKPLKSN